MIVTMTGSMLGAIFGLAHAIYVFRVMVRQPSGHNPPAILPALYAAVWTFALWLLFGTYLMLLWLLGCLLYPFFGGRRA